MFDTMIKSLDIHSSTHPQQQNDTKNIMVLPPKRKRNTHSYRWERILIAIDDDDDDDDNDTNHDSTTTTTNTIQVQLESSTIGSSPLFTSQHAIDLLSKRSSSSSISTTKTKSITNTARKTNPTTTLILVDHVHIQAGSIPTQSYPTTTTTAIAIASSYYTTMKNTRISGPSGIMIQVQLSVICSGSTTSTTKNHHHHHHHHHYTTTTTTEHDNDRYQLSSTDMQNIKAYFIQTILPYLSGYRRIILAPLSSIKNIRLHRYVKCYQQQSDNYYSDSNHNINDNPPFSSSSSSQQKHTIQCTTILPLDGLHAALFSTEGIHAFLKQQPNGGASNSRSGSGGIWSPYIATPMIWSHFLLGSGYPIPQSLEDAIQAAYTTTSTTTTRTSSSSSKRSHLVDRRMLWIDWKRIDENVIPKATIDTTTTSNSSNHIVMDDTTTYEVRYGIQYTMKFVTPIAQNSDKEQQQESITFSLNDIFPSIHNSNSKNTRHAMKNTTTSYYQSDIFADQSIIEIISSHNNNNNNNNDNTQQNNVNQLEWGTACQSTSLPSNNRYDTNYHLVRTVSSFESISRTEPCFVVTKKKLSTILESKTDTSDTTMEYHQHRTQSSTSYWKVQTHLWRPYMSHGGTYSGYIQNKLEHCGTYITVQQSIPGIMIPIWSSLLVRVTSSSHNSNNYNNEKTLDFIPWYELNDFFIEFDNTNDSFVLHIQHIVPPLSLFEIRFIYEPKFLSINHFPADANRGFEIPPMIVQFLIELDGTDHCHSILEQTYTATNDNYHTNNVYESPIVTLYSNPLLLLTPLPDMSMPFNVLSFTCTFYVFVIGSIINLFLKKVSAQVKAKLNKNRDEEVISFKQRLKLKITSFVQSIRNKLLKIRIHKEKLE